MVCSVVVFIVIDFQNVELVLIMCQGRLTLINVKMKGVAIGQRVKMELPVYIAIQVPLASM